MWSACAYSAVQPCLHEHRFRFFRLTNRRHVRDGGFWTLSQYVQANDPLSRLLLLSGKQPRNAQPWPAKNCSVRRIGRPGTKSCYVIPCIQETSGSECRSSLVAEYMGSRITRQYGNYSPALKAKNKSCVAGRCCIVSLGYFQNQLRNFSCSQSWTSSHHSTHARPLHQANSP